MSAVVDRSVRAEPPAGWDRLERAAEEAALAVGFWKRRALEAEDELQRLRRTLEAIGREREQAEPKEDLREEIRRLRAENAALGSRMKQARARVGALLRRLGALEVEP